MITIKVDRKWMGVVQINMIERAVQTTLQVASKTSDSDLTVVVTNDSRLRKLNRQFRNINRTTDVLSFPSDEMDPDSSNPYLGDVVISFPQAQKQAMQCGYPVENELQLLTVHGVLHLLGFNHEEKKTKARMWRYQGKALDVLDLKSINILEDSL